MKDNLSGKLASNESTSGSESGSDAEEDEELDMDEEYVDKPSGLESNIIGWATVHSLAIGKTGANMQHTALSITK